ncbi:unnamed protein product, partial [Heterosigma akashiwo]
QPAGPRHRGRAGPALGRPGRGLPGQRAAGPVQAADELEPGGAGAVGAGGQAEGRGQPGAAEVHPGRRGQDQGPHAADR